MANKKYIPLWAALSLVLIMTACTPEAKYGCDDDKEELQLAIIDQNIDKVREMFASKDLSASINEKCETCKARNSLAQPSLYLALFQTPKNDDIIEILLENGADITYCDSERKTILMKTLCKKNLYLATIKKILKKSKEANMLQATDREDRNALMYALMHYPLTDPNDPNSGGDSVEIIKELIEETAGVDLADKKGKTALRHALENGRVPGEIIFQLINKIREKGKQACLGTKATKDGKTVLQFLLDPKVWVDNIEYTGFIEVERDQGLAASIAQVLISDMTPEHAQEELNVLGPKPNMLGQVNKAVKAGSRLLRGGTKILRGKRNTPPAAEEAPNTALSLQEQVIVLLKQKVNPLISQLGEPY